MKKLRINRIQYRNQGTTNPALRSQMEHHVTFKFDTEQEAITFKDNVKNWYYNEISNLESQIEKLANFIMQEIDGEPSKNEGAVECAIRLLKKCYDESKTLDKEPDKPQAKAKGRPKKDL